MSIQSTLGAEGRPVTVRIDNHRPDAELWVHFPIPMARAWDNVIYTCTTMLLFESEAEIDAWSERHRLPRGDARPLAAVYDFAREWYGQHLSPQWRKWTTDEARAIFRRHGFTGPIWELPRSAERF